MVGRIAFPSLAVVVALFLAACQSRAGVAPQTVPASTTAPELETSSSTDLTRPINSTLRDSGAGGVTLEATWLGMQDGGALAFQVALDTHSVDLSKFDVAANMALRDGGGREIRPGDWQDESRDSHHRAGTVRFPAPPPGVDGGRATLVVRNLAGVPERTLGFEFQR